MQTFPTILYSYGIPCQCSLLFSPYVFHSCIDLTIHFRHMGITSWFAPYCANGYSLTVLYLTILPSLFLIHVGLLWRFTIPQFSSFCSDCSVSLTTRSYSPFTGSMIFSSTPTVPFLCGTFRLFDRFFGCTDIRISGCSATEIEPDTKDWFGRFKWNDTGIIGQYRVSQKIIGLLHPTGFTSFAATIVQ